MKASGYEELFTEDDFKNQYKETYPIVLGYNGSHHYCPTMLISPNGLNRFKVEMFMEYMNSGNEMLKMLDLSLIGQGPKEQILNLGEEVTRTCQVLVDDGYHLPDDFTAFQAKVSGLSQGSCQPYFNLPSGVPGSQGTQSAVVLPPSSPEDSPAHKKRKYKCEECDEVFTRWDQKEDHKKKKHGDATGIICPQCGKAFAATKGLKEHIRQQHEGSYKFKCPYAGPEQGQCKFKGTDGVQAFDRHMTKQHGEGALFTCPKCQKSNIQGTASLQRHLKEDKCTALKNFECLACGKWYKSKEYLEKHIKEKHKEGDVSTLSQTHSGKEGPTLSKKVQHFVSLATPRAVPTAAFGSQEQQDTAEKRKVKKKKRQSQGVGTHLAFSSDDEVQFTDQTRRRMDEPFPQIGDSPTHLAEIGVVPDTQPEEMDDTLEVTQEEAQEEQPAAPVQPVPSDAAGQQQK